MVGTRDGDHTVFECGIDAAPKAQVTAHLTDWLGWLWLRGALKTGQFNIKMVR